MEYVTLRGGVQMPLLGFGVYQVTPDACARCVTDALRSGYRAIDTAQAYENEEGVGQALAAGGWPREEVFITTKVWVSHAGEKQAAASIDASLRKLRTDYIDLLLIHQPYGDYYGTWRAMVAAQKAGKVRAIGVSNFLRDRYQDLVEFSGVIPAVNQVETHVFCQQRALQAQMARYGTVTESWGPLAEGKNDMFRNAVLRRIGAAHGKTAAQVALRSLVQRGIACIPKTTHVERMRENIAIFDFELSPAEEEQIAALDTGAPLICRHDDPAFIRYIADLCE
ncbi:MAG: aldo/keto reductase [Akkermansia sp.]